MTILNKVLLSLYAIIFSVLSRAFSKAKLKYRLPVHIITKKMRFSMSFDQKRLLFLGLSVSLIVQMISFSWLLFSINFSVFFKLLLYVNVYIVCRYIC